MTWPFPREISAIIFHYVGVCRICLKFVCHEWRSILDKEAKCDSRAHLFLVPRLAADGYFNLMRWAVKQGSPLSHKSVECVVRSGDLETFKFLFQHGYFLHDYITNYAIEMGQLHILQWLYPNPFTISVEIISDIVRHGTIEMIKWIVDSGRNLVLTDPCYQNSLKLEIKEYLNSQNIQFNKRIIIDDIFARNRCLIYN